MQKQFFTRFSIVLILMVTFFLFGCASSDGGGSGGGGTPPGTEADTDTDTDTDDVGAYAYHSKFGISGTGNGEFDFYNDNHGGGIALDSIGNIYVTDSNNNRVQKFDSSGDYVTQWGSIGNGDNQFNWPYGIAIDASDDVYIADSGNGRIQKYESDGTYLGWFGDCTVGASAGVGWHDPGSCTSIDNNSLNDGGFNVPQGITYHNSLIYVTDTQNNRRVQVFDASGDFQFKFGSQGTADGEFTDGLSGIAVDSDGNIYVADQHKIQKFNSSGVFQAKIGSGTSGEAEDEFNDPEGLATDDSDQLYIADMDNNIIKKFDTDATFDGSAFVTQFGGTQGEDDGEFDYPIALAVSNDGSTVYIVDQNNDRIQIFKKQ